jgi:hypothetical protein
MKSIVIQLVTMMRPNLALMMQSPISGAQMRMVKIASSEAQILMKKKVDGREPLKKCVIT